MKSVRMLIEGIGSIGGVVAGKLIRSGFKPTLVTENEDVIEHEIWRP